MPTPPSSTVEHSTPVRHCAVDFQALPSRLGQVHGIVAAQLRYWRLDPLADATARGLTELLTTVHGQAESGGEAGPATGTGGVGTAAGGCTVELSFAWNRLTVSVHDRAPQPPHGTARTRWFSLPAPPPDAASRSRGSGSGPAATPTAAPAERQAHTGSTVPAPPLTETEAEAAPAG